MLRARRGELGGEARIEDGPLVAAAAAAAATICGLVSLFLRRGIRDGDDRGDLCVAALSLLLLDVF